MLLQAHAQKATASRLQAWARHTPHPRKLALQVRANKTEPAEAAPQEPAAEASSKVNDLVKETFMQTVKGDATTAKEVFGEGTLNQLKQVLGEERADKFIGALDGLLANRRLATLIFAVVDVALIWVVINVFKGMVFDK